VLATRVNFGFERRVRIIQPLNVTHAVRSDSFAGVERYVCEVVNGLVARGHSARVIGGDPERMTAELRPEVTHVRASSTAEVLRGFAEGGRVDLVHTHMTAAEVAAIASRCWHRAPVIATRHFPDRRARSLPKVVGGVVRLALAEQIAISRFVARGIGEPTVVIHNGVPTRPAAELVCRQVLMMQRLDPEKAPGVGLHAWALSGLARSGWRLTIAGSGRLAASLQSLGRGLGIADSISFLGRVTDTDSLLQASSILLAPAPTEPFGLSVTEAMAHGLPVVAAAGGAHAETLGPEGTFFAPGDAAGAAAHLIRFAGDLGLRRAEGFRARRRQQELFSLERHVSRLEELYLWHWKRRGM
jgi:glycosyltransferase involved in cell wall biosynthesis